MDMARFMIAQLDNGWFLYQEYFGGGFQKPTMQVQDWQSTDTSALVAATNKQQNRIRLN